MKVYELSTKGLTLPKASRVRGHSGKTYYVFSHGEVGRNRWEIRIPLQIADFPVTELPDVYTKGMRTEKEKTFPDIEFELVCTDKRDPLGNPNFILRKSDSYDLHQLIFWNLSPGFRGGASYSLEGDASIITKGSEADGIAGNMMQADCPIVLVTGPCVLNWKREGRLYGEPAEWRAEFNGLDNWVVGPAHELELESVL